MGRALFGGRKIVKVASASPALFSQSEVADWFNSHCHRERRQMIMRNRQTFLRFIPVVRPALVGVLISLPLFSACGNGESSAGLFPGQGKQEDSAKCANSGEAVTSISAENMQQMMGDPEYTGELVLEILSVEELPRILIDPYIDQTFEAKGKFVGVRYRLTNNANVEVQPVTQIGRHLKITNGEQSWADSDSLRFGSVADGWADENGDSHGAEMVGPGFSIVTWTVFDTPVQAVLSGLSVQSETGKMYCLGLPK